MQCNFLQFYCHHPLKFRLHNLVFIEKSHSSRYLDNITIINVLVFNIKKISLIYISFMSFWIKEFHHQISGCHFWIDLVILYLINFFALYLPLSMFVLCSDLQLCNKSMARIQIRNGSNFLLFSPQNHEIISFSQIVIPCLMDLRWISKIIRLILLLFHSTPACY